MSWYVLIVLAKKTQTQRQLWKRAQFWAMTFVPISPHVLIRFACLSQKNANTTANMKTVPIWGYDFYANVTSCLDMFCLSWPQERKHNGKHENGPYFGLWLLCQCHLTSCYVLLVLAKRTQTQRQTWKRSLFWAITFVPISPHVLICFACLSQKNANTAANMKTVPTLGYHCCANVTSCRDMFCLS